MKELKESLLGKTNDKVATAKNDIKKLKYFGGFFDVDYTSLIYVTPRNVGKMSLRALKKHIVPDVVVEDVENTLRYAQTKAVALVNYLYGLSIDDFNIDWRELCTNTDVRKKFGELLETKMIENGVFGMGEYYVYVQPYHKHYAAELCITFVRNDKWSEFTLGFNKRK